MQKSLNKANLINVRIKLKIVKIVKIVITLIKMKKKFCLSLAHLKAVFNHKKVNKT